MNLADPELELLDPTPNVHSLFLHFDELFFFTKLASRAVVRWSKRMYSCAGICSYEGRGGLCDIALSEPLLKLRPRKDLVETLLHEMIHAFLFVTCKDQDRDGHGPNFKSHMYRINQAAGLNISVYHDFHDEVKLYQTHWWRCDGPCQTRKPHFGIVRRSWNRAPCPKDFWWNDHRRICGGTFIKIKEPENYAKTRKKSVTPSADITKYITIGKENTPSQNTSKQINNPASTKGGVGIKTNSSSTLVVSKKNNIVFNPQFTTKSNQPIIFSGNGKTLGSNNKEVPKQDVIETVRNIWAKKQPNSTGVLRPDRNEVVQTVRSIWTKKLLSTTPTSFTENKLKSSTTSSPEVKKVNNKKKSDEILVTPHKKLKTLDDYLKSASSVLKDIYGKDFNMTVSSNNKIVPVAVKPSSEPQPTNSQSTVTDLVECPVCSKKVSSNIINKHLDECLNTGLIEKIKEDSLESKKIDSLIDLVDNLPTMPARNGHFEVTKIVVNNNTLPEVKVESIDLTFIDIQNNINDNNRKIKMESNDDDFDYIDLDNIPTDSNKVIVPKEEKEDKKDNAGVDFKLPSIKIEPSTSKDVNQQTKQKCPCCGIKVDVSIQEHLDDCLAFFNSGATQEGPSTSFVNETILISDDDDDMFDETQTFNATGTKSPCPCCLTMVEQDEMNEHLDICLSS